MKILMVAAENDALPGGKVGGIGDVLRDIPAALAEMGQLVDVVLPGYGRFSKLSNAERCCLLPVIFGGKTEFVEVFRLPLSNQPQGVCQYVLEHPLFYQSGVGQIYCDDPANRPFATDASKFALFCAAVAEAVSTGVFDHIDVIHLHDWHSALLAVLRAYDPQYAKLKSIHTVYTIHNLALQGVRPLAGDESSLFAWFPNLAYDRQQIIDPRYPNCINLMRCGINLCDRIHAVSPTYAREILSPSDTVRGYFGGEGLEQDLQHCNKQQRLVGILNGCQYPQQQVQAQSLQQLLPQLEQQLLNWMAAAPEVKSAHQIALHRVMKWQQQHDVAPQLLITAVGRLTEQKASLLQQKLSDHQTALDCLLTELADTGVFIFVGSGDKSLTAFMTQTMAKHSNLLFLNGYSPELPDALFASGQLFIMPSSFEPCGISQMLAMRAGQPCLVHQVGGLKDTVTHMKNGFGFNGDSPQQQAENLLSCFKSAIALYHHQPKRWSKIATQAGKARFSWQASAKQYMERLYDIG